MRETGCGRRQEKVWPLWQLLVGFTRIGLLSFGGGTGIAALLEHELVHRWRSFTAKEFTELFALGRAIPGVIGANLAFVYGWVLAGFPGALAGVIGICLLPLCLSLPLMKWLFEVGGSIPSCLD